MKNVPIDTQCKTLNLASDEEYAYLMRNLGGEEKIRARFPEVYSRILTFGNRTKGASCWTIRRYWKSRNQLRIWWTPCICPLCITKTKR